MREIESPSVAENPPPILQNAFLPYLLKAVLGFGAIFVFSRFIDSMGVWLFYTLSLILAVPIAFRLAYFRAIRRTHVLSIFDDNSWVRRFFAGVVLRLLFSFLFGLVLALAMVFRLRALQWQEWVTCIVAIPVFWLIVHYLTLMLTRQVAPLFRVAVAVRWVSCSTIIALLLVYCVLIAAFPEPLASELAPWKSQVSAGEITSATVRELAVLQDEWLKLETFVLGRISDYGEWGWSAALMIFVLGQATFFFGWISMLACFCIPRSEISRAFCRPTAQVEPPTPPLTGIALGAAIFVILTGFLFQGAAIIESYLKQHAPVKVFVKRYRPIVEKIGSQFVRAGTIQQLRDAQNDWLSSEEKNTVVLTQKIDDAFKHMERNVDVFLDWYYSLPADYVRIAKLLTGEFENYLDKQLRLTLNRGEPFEGFESYFLSIRDSDPARRSKYKDVLERILSENSITVSDPSDVFVTEKIEDPNAFSLNPESAFEIAHQRFKMRGFLATGAATPSAVVGIKLGVGVAKAVSKTVVAKGVIKVAAKAIAKVVAWSVGVKIGSIIGGAVGSLVPIAGTVAGAAVGGSVGALGLAVGVDKLLLEIEETIDRSEFRATLVEALNQERQKMLNAVRHSTTEGRESQSPSS